MPFFFTWPHCIPRRSFILTHRLQRCLSIARSHAIAGSAVNALALIDHARSLVQQASSDLLQQPEDINDQHHPLSVDVHPDAVSFLSNLVNGELQRHRAIVHIHNLREAERKEAKEGPEPTLLESLNTYPRRLNLRNIVQFPPKMALIPVKPIFLDVAWNYIDYPGRTSHSPLSGAAAAAKAEQEQPKKKGWFGFGR